VPAPSSRTFTRRSLLGVIGVGATLATVGLPGTASAEDHTTTDQDVRPRCATFNIHHGAGVDGVLDLERVARVIEAQNLDVVGLQEVDRFWARSGFVDQPQWLAQRLGMYCVFGANLDLDPDGDGQPRRQYGTVILSRTRILTWSNTPLPRSEGREQRGLLSALVHSGRAPFEFLNTHLDHTGPAERLPQCEAIMDILGPRPRRTIIVGDLNCKPGTEEYGLLTSELDDAWTEAGHGDGFTYPAPIPDGRLDYVLSSRDARPSDVEVLYAEPMASDHLPVRATYRFR